MSLKQARRIAKRLHKAGRPCQILSDRAACLKHNPKMHRMNGGYVVRTAALSMVWD